MLACALTRRAAIVGLPAFAFLSAVAARHAHGQPMARFREIRVDVSPLRASAGDPTAEWVEHELAGDLARALAPYTSPGEHNGATLVARIEYVYLGPSGGGAGPSGASQDSIQGVLVVRGPRGGVAAETPLRAIATYYSMSVDQPLFEEAYHARVVALAQAFAGWAPRQLGL